ncbi:hypothetical protein Tco_0073781 [Tanacetum coccineum]
MGTTRLRWGSKSSWGECSITKSCITCDKTNGNTTLSEAQGVSLRITSGVRVTLAKRENVGFDLTKSVLFPSFVEDQTAKGISPSTKSVNNEAPIIQAELITTIPPSGLVENIGDSDDALSNQDDVAVVNHSNPQNSKVPPPAGKTTGVASEPLNMDNDPDIHVANVTPPSWKKYLKEISLEKLYDIHDKAYIRQVILDNTLNRRTRKLMFALSKAQTSCDTIREREVVKDKAYAELERKCNEALQDLDKNPLVLDMHFEIETFEGLKHDRAAVVSKVVLGVATKLIHSDEMGLLVAKLVKAAIFCGKCTAFKEVASLKEPFILEKMPGYRSSLKEEFDRAGDGLANASYPFLAEVTADLYAFIEQLLLKKPQFLRSKPALSHSKPSSLKVPIM